MIPDNIGNSPRPACIGIASNTDTEGEYSFLGPKGTGNTGLTTVAPVEIPGRIDGSCRRGSFNEDESACILKLAAK